MDELQRLGWHTPVAVSVAPHDAAGHVVVFHVQHPFFQRIVVLADGFHVAKTVIEHLSCCDHGTRPGHIVSVAAPIRRNDIGQRAVLPLAVFGIGEPFGIKLMVVENIRLAKTTCGVVAGPTHAFIALRTVSGHGAVIAPNAPESVVIHCVNDFVGGLKRACNRHFVVNHPAFKIIQIRCFAQARNLHIAKTVIDEHRVPVELRV